MRAIHKMRLCHTALPGRSRGSREHPLLPPHQGRWEPGLCFSFILVIAMSATQGLPPTFYSGVCISSGIQ